MNDEKRFRTQGMMSAHASKKRGGKAAAAFVVLLVILASGGGVAAWAKSVTDPTPEVARTATLHIVSGTVHVKAASESQSHVAKDGELLEQGENITTDADTEAELHFFDNSVARLSAETDVTLDTLVHDANKPNEDKVGIMVNVGRVWSRVLNLLSLNAEFTVQSSTTVATVRGTAFDFSVQKDKNGTKWTHVNGADSIVDCKAKKWNGIVKRGEWLHVPEPVAKAKDIDDVKNAPKEEQKRLDDKGVMLGNVMPSAVDMIWTKQNADGDTRFLKQKEDERKRDEAKLVRAFELPVVGAILERVAEKRLENAEGEKRDAMLATWAERKIAQANRLTDQGQDEAALKIMDAVKEKVEGIDVRTSGLVQQKIDEAIGRGETAKELGDKLIEHMPELRGAKNDEGRALMKSVLLENRMRMIEESAGKDGNEELMEFDPKLLNDLNPILKQRMEYLREWREKLMNMDSGTPVPVIDVPRIDETQIKTIEDLRTTIEKLPISDSDRAIVKPILESIEKLPLPIVNPEVLPEPIVIPKIELPQPTIIIMGPDSMQADGNGQYSAFLVMPDGSRKDISREGTWSVVGNGTIRDGAFLPAEKVGTDVIVFTAVGPDGQTHTAKKSVLVEPMLQFNM